jgi:hypothetical protein
VKSDGFATDAHVKVIRDRVAYLRDSSCSSQLSGASQLDTCGRLDGFFISPRTTWSDQAITLVNQGLTNKMIKLAQSNKGASRFNYYTLHPYTRE